MWTVEPASAGIRLVNYLHQQLGPPYTIKQLKRMLDHSLCEVNGQVEKFASTPVKIGDRISLILEEIADRVNFEKTRILYEDDVLLAYNKGPGIAVDGPSGLGSLISAEHTPVELVHRIDRDTSGVILFVKTVAARKYIEDQFRERVPSKVYLAMVSGVPSTSSGLIKNYLGVVQEYHGQKVYASTARHNGKLAETAWKVLKKGDGMALVECRPKTGRTHQIRVHMLELGHPILGDTHYARRRLHQDVRRCLLHAAELTVLHPASGEPMTFRAPLPDDFGLIS